MAEWTFLTNHARVLALIARQPRSTALDLAESIGITERQTRRIINTLQETGYITKEREGRYNRYSINPKLPLRHPSDQDTLVGDLLKALARKTHRRSPKSR